jgi:hypothetical protein
MSEGKYNSSCKNYYTLPINREKKSRKTDFPEVRPLFGNFCTKSAKIRLQIFPAALLSIRPLLSYAAEYSACWQHCFAMLSDLNSAPSSSLLTKGREPPHKPYLNTVSALYPLHIVTIKKSFSAERKHCRYVLFQNKCRS